MLLESNLLLTTHIKRRGAREYPNMLYSQAVALLALATTVVSAPSGELTKRAQTVYLAGDSTMARASGVITGIYFYFNMRL